MDLPAPDADVDMDKEKEMDTDMEKEKDMDMDMEKEKDMDMDMDKDMDMETGTDMDIPHAKEMKYGNTSKHGEGHRKSRPRQRPETAMFFEIYSRVTTGITMGLRFVFLNR